MKPPSIARATRVRATRSLLATTALAALAGLVACAAPPKTPLPRYVAPDAGPTARLVIRGSLQAGERYGVFVLEDADACRGHRLIGAGDDSHHPATTTLAADRPHTLEFRFLRVDRRMCVVRWTFTPAAGKSYLFNGADVPGTCRAGLIDMSDPDHLRPETTAVRRNTRAEACVPIARAKGYGGSSDSENAEAVLREGAGDDDLRGLIGR